MDSNLITDNELTIRLGIFATIFILIAVYEVMAPRRHLEFRRSIRWSNNLAIAVLNTIVLRLIFPGAAVGIAVYADSFDWSLLNYFTLPILLEIICAVLLLDLAIYFQHRAFHAIPFFWRLHRLHHADMDFDVTTGLRFHPLEIIVSMLIKGLVIVIIGAPVSAVMLFELLLSSTSLFNHGNIKIPDYIDWLIRWFIVTPDMHRIHHSSIATETDSNFGFNLPWWDRLFRTYSDLPKSGHRQMRIGLNEFRDPRELRIDHLLTQPFRKTKK